MRLYHTTQGPVVEHEGRWVALPAQAWDALVAREDLAAVLADAVASGVPLRTPIDLDHGLQPPIGRQEVWAAGVTYFRSRTARMEESRDAGGSDFYDRVYHADRPELFFKATPARVVGHRGVLRLRPDSSWVVPEPELTLLVSRTGTITGYTVGNDLSCRDIEGENPLYLPQAKTFDGCAALGPGLWVADTPLPPETTIELSIHRAGAVVFSGTTHLSQMKKSLESLVAYLFRAASFPHGCLLMTGTGIVPPDAFTLQPGDEVRITIEPIGTLINTIE